MVTETNMEAPTDKIIHTETHTKCFLGDKECGEGTLYVAESLLTWQNNSNDSDSVKLQYPSISLHAISKDTSNFPHECLYCLLESEDIIDTDERDPQPGVTEVRFVPINSENIQAIYDAVTLCQELHPDPDMEYDDEDEQNIEQDFPEGHFFTAEDNLDNVELSEEGQAILQRLTQNMQIANQGETNGDSVANGQNGQFDDADHM